MDRFTANEVYDKAVVEDHAARVVSLLARMNATEFLVQHARARCRWLPPESKQDPDTIIQAKFGFFSKHLPGVDPCTFDGGLLFD